MKENTLQYARESDFMQFSLLNYSIQMFSDRIYFALLNLIFHTSYTNAKIKEPGNVFISKEKGSGYPVFYAKPCAPEKQRIEPDRR